MKTYLCSILILPAILLSLSCNKPNQGKESAPERIKMATTTSLEDSGVLDVLLPPFERTFNVKVDVIAVGSGKALKLAENGDVDVVFVHDRDAENKFIADGFGINHREVMFNDFVIVGPDNDPAGIKGTDASTAFRKIARNHSLFISRGDESGTHKKEQQMWKLTGITPENAWHLETGQGMGTTLRIADEKKAYCLIDRGTYIAFASKVQIVILSEGDEKLSNPYAIMSVNPLKQPHCKYTYAMALIGWVTSPDGRKIIKEYKKNGQELFHPSAY